MFQNCNKDTKTMSLTLFRYFIVNFEQIWFILLVFLLRTLSRQMAAVRSLLYIWKMLMLLMVDLFCAMNNVDWKSSLSRLSSHPTHLFQSSDIYFWEFHPNSPCLLKIFPFIKDLGVGYKVIPIICFKNPTMQPSWISSTIAEFNFLFCPCALILHKMFLAFSKMKSKFAKINSAKKKFWTISATRNSLKKLYGPFRKNSPLRKKIATGMNKFISSTDHSIYIQC